MKLRASLAAVITTALCILFSGSEMLRKLSQANKVQPSGITMPKRRYDS